MSDRRALAVALALAAACNRDRENVGDAKPPFGPLVVDAATVPSCLNEHHAADFLLEGAWLWKRELGFERVALSVKRTGPASFELEFVRGTCFGYFEHRTRATWSGAGLVLEQWSAGFPFVLYPARLAGEECLVTEDTFDPARKPLEYAFRRDEEGLVEKRFESIHDADRAR